MTRQLNKKDLRAKIRRSLKIGVSDRTQTGDLLGHNQAF